MSETATTTETSVDVMPPSTFMADMVKSLETNLAQVTNPDKVVVNDPATAKADTNKVDKTVTDKTVDKTAVDATKTVSTVTDDTPGELSEKGKANWKSLKAAKEDFESKFKAADERATKLAADFEEFKKTATQPATDTGEMAALKKQLEEYSTIVRQLNVENHPKFKAHFEAKTASAVELAKAAVGPTFAAKAEEIIKMPDGQEKENAIEAFIDELPRSRQASFGAALAEFDKVKIERAAAIRQETENWSKTQSEMTAKQAEQTAKHNELRTQTIAKAKETALNLEGFKTIEGNEEHNKGVATRLAFVEDFFQGKIDPKMVPAIPAMVGDYMDAMNRRIPALQSEVKKLTDQLQALQAGNPNPGGDKAGGTQPAGEDAPLAAGPDFVKRLAGMMGK